MYRLRFLIAITFISLFLLPSTVYADGIIIPEPICEKGIPCPPQPVPPRPPCQPGVPCPPPPRPITQLNIKYHHVQVKIENQVAVTRVDQVFFNPNTFAIEGTYIFPLPKDAVVTRFTLWVDGKPVEGKVLDAGEARKVYEEIVRSQKDPALLEYVGQGMVQARIFPIPPKGERRIELEYTQALKSESGLVKYVYPLNTEKFSLAPIESVSITVEMSASQPIRAVYSPSHPVQVTRGSDFKVSASYEAKNIKPDADFALFFSLGQTQAFHLLTYRDSKDTSDKDGFFLLMLAPQPVDEAVVVSKDVILVLDQSGSMDGEKFKQAQSALKFILKKLNSEDRFGLVAFSSGVELFASGLQRTTEISKAVAWVDRLSARGSTDINRALLEAVSLADKSRLTYLIFLTDGLPTVGETRREKIIDNFSKVVPANIRLFSFGVGYDVDTFMLDTLSQENHGLSTYVRPGEPLDAALSGFYERIGTPVLTNLSLDFGAAQVYDIYPMNLPDLYSGSQAIITGRYRAPGKFEVILKGVTNNNNPQVFKYPEQSFVEDNRGESGVLASLPRLWATRKVGFLLNKIRLEGANQEFINQIVKLSIRYGIVTPYTSYLVTETMPLGALNQERVAKESYRQYQAAPPAPASGQGAVDKAAEQGKLSQAQQVPVSTLPGTDIVKQVGGRTFVYTQNTWVDTRYDPAVMKPYQVQFLSEQYFLLIQTRPDIAPALALGEKVLVVVDGSAYEVITEQAPSVPITMPTTIPATQLPLPIPTTTPVFTPASPAQTVPNANGSSEPTGLSPAVVAAIIFVVLVISAGATGIWKKTR